jgi:hypothetical protein
MLADADKFLMGDYDSSCTCTICLDELDSQIDSCPCGHVYHRRCLHEWVSQKRTCPQCKGIAVPITKVEFPFIDMRRTKSLVRLDITDAVGAIDSDIARLRQEVDDESSLINVLEPQIASFKEKERVYDSALNTKRAETKLREDQHIRSQEQLREYRSDYDRKRVEYESMRAHLNTALSGMPYMLDPMERSSSSSTMKRVSSRMGRVEVNKLINFVHSNNLKMDENRREIQINIANIENNKDKLNELKLKFNHNNPNSIITVTQSHNRFDGFIPIDSLGLKRRRDEENLKNFENKKPSIFPNSNSSNFQQNSKFLELIANCLSDDDEEMDDVPPPPGPVDTITTPSMEVIELD